MPKFLLYFILIHGMTAAARADAGQQPAVQVEAPAEAQIEATGEAGKDPIPVKAQATTKTQPKPPVSVLDTAAQADPDVAVRMATDYPLDGEEWREYPLGVLEMEMQEAIEDLASGKPKPPALVTQPRIISRLDVMIAELEKKTGGGTGSNNAGDKPAEKSVLRKGQMKDGQLRAVKTDGDRWADLPAKEREKILQSKGDGFPAGYEDVLADYFRKLSKAEKPVAATPLGPQGSK